MIAVWRLEAIKKILCVNSRQIWCSLSYPPPPRTEDRLIIENYADESGKLSLSLKIYFPKRTHENREDFPNTLLIVFPTH